MAGLRLSLCCVVTLLCLCTCYPLCIFRRLCASFHESPGRDGVGMGDKNCPGSSDARTVAESLFPPEQCWGPVLSPAVGCRRHYLFGLEPLSDTRADGMEQQSLLCP